MSKCGAESYDVADEQAERDDDESDDERKDKFESGHWVVPKRSNDL